MLIKNRQWKPSVHNEHVRLWPGLSVPFSKGNKNTFRSCKLLATKPLKSNQKWNWYCYCCLVLNCLCFKITMLSIKALWFLSTDFAHLLKCTQRTQLMSSHENKVNLNAIKRNGREPLWGRGSIVGWARWILCVDLTKIHIYSTCI